MVSLWTSNLHVVPKAKPSYETESNWHLVLGDQKVLPEVRNRFLLLGGFFSSLTFKRIVMNPQGHLPFNPFNIRYTDDSKLQLEKFSELEVSVL